MPASFTKIISELSVNKKEKQELIKHSQPIKRNQSIKKDTKISHKLGE